VIGRLLILIGGSLAFWVLIALPARALLEDPEQIAQAITYSGTAVLLCLVPTTVTLCWGCHALRRDPEQQLLAVLGGNGIRLFSVLLAGWVLTRSLPTIYGDSSFWNWLLGAYLFTLALEMALLLTSRPLEGSASQPVSVPVNK
jgi:hypothetical protein